MVIEHRKTLVEEGHPDIADMARSISGADAMTVFFQRMLPHAVVRRASRDARTRIPVGQRDKKEPREIRGSYQTHAEPRPRDVTKFRRAREVNFAEIERGRGTKMVDMNDEDILYATPGERSAIATTALGGCTAVAVEFFHPDNPEQKGTIVAHYDPVELSVGAHEMPLRFRFDEISESGMQVRALIASPGQLDPESPTGHSPSPSETERIASLTAFLKRHLGKDTPVTSVGYSGNGNYGSAMLAEYPAEGGPRPNIYLDSILIPMEN